MWVNQNRITSLETNHNLSLEVTLVVLHTGYISFRFSAFPNSTLDWQIHLALVWWHAGCLVNPHAFFSGSFIGWLCLRLWFDRMCKGTKARDHPFDHVQRFAIAAGFLSIFLAITDYARDKLAAKR